LKVNDSDISGEYAGGCVNGLAQGRGKAKGRDTYEGEFKQGYKDGKGIYAWVSGGEYNGGWLKDKRNGTGIDTWADGSQYKGEFKNDLRDGFGKLTLNRKNTKAINIWEGKGKWVGDIYVVEGMFEEGRLAFSCTSLQNCKQEQARRETQERDRVANACNNFYQGKSIGFKPAGFSYFGSVLDAVVLGKGNGNVSIKIVDRHFTDLYGKTLEMSCTSDQLQ
jgi:hypothetical protein